MKIEFSNEVLSIEDGTYQAVVNGIHEYGNEGKALVKLDIEEKDVTLISFTSTEALGRYPWSDVFRALNTDDTDELIGKKIKIEVKNEEKGDTCYCNIKKITVV